MSGGLGRRKNEDEVWNMRVALRLGKQVWRWKGMTAWVGTMIAVSTTKRARED